VHSNKYYELEVNYFKSLLDQRLLNTLWNEFWVKTLTSSSILNNAGYFVSQINDVSEKLHRANTSLVHTFASVSERKTLSDEKLVNATKDSNKLTTEILSGFMSQTIKESLFSSCKPMNNEQQ